MKLNRKTLRKLILTEVKRNLFESDDYNTAYGELINTKSFKKLIAGFVRLLQEENAFSMRPAVDFEKQMDVLESMLEGILEHSEEVISSIENKDFEDLDYDEDALIKLIAGTIDLEYRRATGNEKGISQKAQSNPNNKPTSFTLILRLADYVLGVDSGDVNFDGKTIKWNDQEFHNPSYVEYLESELKKEYPLLYHVHMVNKWSNDTLNKVSPCMWFSGLKVF